MTLFWHNAGPLIKYDNGMLVIEDLNPENQIRFRMSSSELLRLAGKLVLAAVRR